MASLEFDAADHLAEVSFQEIKREYMRRVIEPADPTESVDPWEPAGLAADIRTAFYLRDASRLEMLLGVLEGWAA